MNGVILQHLPTTREPNKVITGWKIGVPQERWQLNVSHVTMKKEPAGHPAKYDVATFMEIFFYCFHENKIETGRSILSKALPLVMAALIKQDKEGVSDLAMCYIKNGLKANGVVNVHHSSPNVRKYTCRMKFESRIDLLPSSSKSTVLELCSKQIEEIKKVNQEIFVDLPAEAKGKSTLLSKLERIQRDSLDPSTKLKAEQRASKIHLLLYDLSQKFPAFSPVA